eukprot:scaffold5506_cov42-Prasinocladus_malaysianus.AAC.2
MQRPPAGARPDGACLAASPKVSLGRQRLAGRLAQARSRRPRYRPPPAPCPLSNGNAQPRPGPRSAPAPATTPPHILRPTWYNKVRLGCQ